MKYTQAIEEHIYNLDTLSDDTEITWSGIHNAVSHATAGTIGFRQSCRKLWLSEEAFDILAKMAEAHKQGDVQECKYLKGIFQVMAKFDCEIYVSSLADKADSLKNNNLHPAYSAIMHLAGSHKQSSIIHLMKPDSSACSLTDEVLDRWKTHYESTLTHSPVNDCLELCDLVNHRVADPGVNTNPLSFEEL